MKVLFIDDEPLIRRGLRAVISWEKYGFTEFLEAEDGEEGLQIIAEQNPSLVIVDICMLNKTGLAMAREARKNNFSGRMIILSGYSDFEYAKTAIEADVTAYLVKPVNPEELIKAVEKSIAELHRTNILSLFSNQPTQLHRKRILSDLITGNLTYTQEIENTYHFNFTTSYYRIISVHKLFNSDSETENDSFYLQLQKDFLSVPISPQELVLIITSVTQMNKLNNSYLTYMQEKEKKALLFILSSIGTQTNLLPNLYNENNNIFAARYYYMTSSNLIDSISLKQQLRNSPSNYNLLEVTNQLIDSIILLDFNEVCELTSSLYQYLVRTQPSRNSIEYMLRNSYLQITQQLTIHYPHLCYDLCSDMELKDFIDSNDYLIESIHFFEKQLKAAIKHIKATCLEKPCLRICQYIESNHTENLKLENIAKNFAYNSSYLGKLFHKETGLNFNTYLDLIRIEHSKKHLDQGASVAVAGEKSGFSNTDYYTKKFKKHVGILPSEYRKQKHNQSVFDN